MQERQSITFEAPAGGGGAALTQANIEGSAISSLGFQQFDTFIAKRSDIKKFHAAEDNTADFTDSMVMRPTKSSHDQNRIRQATALTLDHTGAEDEKMVGRETATVSNYNKQRTSVGKLPDIYPSGMP